MVLNQIIENMNTDLHLNLQNHVYNSSGRMSKSESFLKSHPTKHTNKLTEKLKLSNETKLN